MPRTRDERLAYARGYNAGTQGRWPDVPIPESPHVVAGLIRAVQNCRAQADALRAAFDEGDEVVKLFDSVTDEADRALELVHNWMQSEMTDEKTLDQEGEDDGEA